MKKSKLNTKRALAWRVIATALLVAVAAWMLALHWHAVSAAVDAARHADAVWLVLAAALMVLTFCTAAATYGVLALHPLVYGQTLLVELAGAFVNRLLPAGLGGLGLNGVYLYRQKHTPAEATAIVSVNNLLGMLAHIGLLIGVVAFQPQVVRMLFERHHVSVPWPGAAFLAAVLLAACMVPRLRARLARFGGNLARSLSRETAAKLLAALLLAALLTITYTTLLLAAARSIGVTLGVFQVFIVFSVGMLVGTATPTPGGLVGVEAGLFAGFVAYGVQSADAGAAVLLFRLISYWLSLLPGAGALIVARSRKLL